MLAGSAETERPGRAVSPCGRPIALRVDPDRRVWRTGSAVAYDRAMPQQRGGLAARQELVGTATRKMEQ